MVFSERLQYGAISWKYDILLIAAQFKFKSKNPFAHI